MNEHHERRHAEMNRVLTSGLQPLLGAPLGGRLALLRRFMFHGGLRSGFGSLCAVERVVMEEAG